MSGVTGREIRAALERIVLAIEGGPSRVGEALLGVRSALARLPADAVLIDEAGLALLAMSERMCPDCGLNAARIGDIHINAQEAGRAAREATPTAEEARPD
jgi:hypothetical protein